MDERPNETPEPPREDEQDLGEFDYMDPLKRGEESEPGLDPIIPPVPPEE